MSGEFVTAEMWKAEQERNRRVLADLLERLSQAEAAAEEWRQKVNAREDRHRAEDIKRGEESRKRAHRLGIASEVLGHLAPSTPPGRRSEAAKTALEYADALLAAAEDAHD